MMVLTGSREGSPWRIATLLGVACIAALPQSGRAQKKVAPMSLVQWFEPPLITSMRLSPDGTHVAGIGQGGNRSVAFVTHIDRGETKVIAKWHPYRSYIYGRWPVAVNWINDDLLALDYSTRDAVSVDRDGKQIATLGERFIRPLFEKGASTDSVLVYRDIADGDLDVVNARSGEKVRYRLGLPGKMLRGAFDASGALRAVTMMDTAFWTETTKVTNWYRISEQGEWLRLDEGPISADHWLPERVLPEPNSLAVLSRKDRDTYAVYRYDTEKRELAEMMAGHPREDILSVSGLDDKHFEYVITAGMQPQIHWFDARWAALQKTIDAALPGSINLMHGDKNGRVLVSSYSDVDPGRWYLLDTVTSKMREIGVARPTIDPDRMRPMQSIRYTARDGLTVNAYLTRPARPVDEPAATVVLIHGGPQVRDRWHWDDEVQLLASRGYVVFQPQFRGSSGFGRKFEEAGYRQWGRSMQDDITDGVKHLIDKKIADPARICIYGGSYGGYAALWGVIKTPELYKCGASFAGVSDLSEMLAGSIFDDSTPVSREISRKRVGDPKEMKAQLDEVSPLRHAERVRVPLFIAHGEEDTRVLASQSKDMVKALQRFNKPVEWMPLENVGHGFFWVRDQVRYHRALLAFLRRHIGGIDAPEAAASAPVASTAQ
jgi:dipeptidyl aminopeptidase/acylaminoacyl peptidase